MNLLLFKLIQTGVLNQTIVLIIFLLILSLLLIGIILINGILDIYELLMLPIFIISAFQLISLSLKKSLNNYLTQISFLDLFKPVRIKTIRSNKINNILNTIKTEKYSIKIISLNKSPSEYSSNLISNSLTNCIIVYTNIDELTLFMLTVDF